MKNLIKSILIILLITLIIIVRLNTNTNIKELLGILESNKIPGNWVTIFISLILLIIVFIRREKYKSFSEQSLYDKIFLTIIIILPIMAFGIIISEYLNGIS
jgi:hypothetical protein